MSEYLVTVPKRHFIPAVMEYNSFQHQDETISGALHAQECTHMNDTAFLLCPVFRKKKKKKKKIDLPTLTIFRPEGQTHLSFF